jgi:hypothetical protein
MNRAQIEIKEVDLEVGRVPKGCLRLEVLIEQTPGNYLGTITHAHGYDDIGTFWYRKAHKKPGFRYKSYSLFPHDLHVIVVNHGEVAGN